MRVAEPQPRGCDVSLPNGPSVALACESVQKETSGEASAVRTSFSSMIAMMQ